MTSSTAYRTAWLYLTRTASAWMVLIALNLPAAAQQTPPPLEDRYGLASEEYAADDPQSVAPLLSYDRAKEEASGATVVGPSKPTNPLRAAAQAVPAPVMTPPEREPPAAPLVADSRPLYSAPPIIPSAAASPTATALAPLGLAPRYDSKLEPAAQEVTLPKLDTAKPQATGGSDAVDSISRRLAPLSTSDADKLDGAAVSKRERGLLPGALTKLQSMSTAGIGLAVVVGLFIVCMMLMRRGGGKSSGALPAEAFTVLGRAPLAAQSFAQLIRVGNKLVLVAMTPSGPQPLTEVTDPMEVGRLIGLCASGASHGPAAEFQQVLAQLAREPARGFLGGEAATAGGRRSS